MTLRSQDMPLSLPLPLSSSVPGHDTFSSFSKSIDDIDCAQPLTADQALTLRDALWRHHVLVFRDQRLDDAALRGFASYFGDIFAPPRNAPVLGADAAGLVPDIVLVANVDDGVLGHDDLVAHSDHHWTPTPSSASLLHALEVPPAGGDTIWTDLEAVHDNLPAALKRRIDGLRVITYNPFLRKQQPLPNGAPLYRTPDIVPLTPHTDHPLVRTHPYTGRKLLYLGAGTEVEVLGLPANTGAALIAELRGHLADSPFTYRHRWAPGDIVFWDNQATLHARDRFDPRARRVLKRISLSGSKPF